MGHTNPSGTGFTNIAFEVRQGSAWAWLRIRVLEAGTRICAGGLLGYTSSGRHETWVSDRDSWAFSRPPSTGYAHHHSATELYLRASDEIVIDDREQPPPDEGFVGGSCGPLTFEPGEYTFVSLSGGYEVARAGIFALADRPVELIDTRSGPARFLSHRDLEGSGPVVVTRNASVSGELVAAAGFTVASSGSFFSSLEAGGGKGVAMIARTDGSGDKRTEAGLGRIGLRDADLSPGVYRFEVLGSAGVDAGSPGLVGSGPESPSLLYGFVSFD